MEKMDYNIKTEYGEQDLKNIILQIFEEYCVNKITERLV